MCPLLTFTPWVCSSGFRVPVNWSGISGGPPGLTSHLGYVLLGSSVVLSIFRGILGVPSGLACCVRVGIGFNLPCSGLGSGRRNLQFLRYPLPLIQSVQFNIR